MFLGIQFPLADVRSFIEGSPRLKRPAFPILLEGKDFLRYGGLARRRVRGTAPVKRWSDDSSFCNANRALVLPDSRQIVLDGVGPSYIFRRFFFDGRAVARVETGFSRPAKHAHGERGESPSANLKDLLFGFLNLPTRVAGVQDRARQQSLLSQSDALARWYYLASTSSEKLRSTQPSPLPVRAGALMAFLECTDEEMDSLPFKSERLPVESFGGLKLAFSRIPYSRREVGVWLLGCNPSDSAQADPERLKLARMIRLCLFRLHAEYQVFKLVLGLIREGVVPYTRGTAGADALEQYLKDSREWIFSKSRFGVDQKAICAAMQGYDALVTTAEKDVLMQQLDAIRPQHRLALDHRLETGDRPPIVQPKYDVFISYNSLDYDEVKAVVEQLKQRGIEPWFDEDRIDAGVNVVDEIDKALDNIRIAALFLGDNGFGHWQAFERRSMVYNMVERQYRIIPVILKSATRDPDFLGLIRPVSRVNMRDSKHDPLSRLVSAISGHDPRTAAGKRVGLTSSANGDLTVDTDAV